MNCGNCTASCPLSADTGGFPRQIIHLLQVGHRDKLRASLEPWLCYYCGECSETCPRDANPADTMMAARRWLTGQYDWTGIGGRIYASKWVPSSPRCCWSAWWSPASSPCCTARSSPTGWRSTPSRPSRASSWPTRLHMAGTLTVLLVSNVWRMYGFVMRPVNGAAVPVGVLLREARTFLLHFLTQQRWRRQCTGSRWRWLKHLLLVSGYVTMMVLVEVFLRSFQTDQVVPIWHPTRLFGYYATAVILYGTGDFLVGRIRRKDWIHKHSHFSDWVFVGLLFLVALTGILVHIARISGLPVVTYDLYVIHLAVVAPLPRAAGPVRQVRPHVLPPLRDLPSMRCGSGSRRRGTRNGACGVSASNNRPGRPATGPPDP